MTTHDDRARDEHPGIDVQGDVEVADIRHDEQPTSARFRVTAEWIHDDALAAGQLASHMMRYAGAETASVEPLDEQPAPTARETAADELVEAEDVARAIASHEVTYAAHFPAKMVVLMAEYDERGRLYERWHGRYLELEAQSAAARAELERERDAARAEAEQLREVLAGQAPAEGSWQTEALALRAELKRLTVENVELIADKNVLTGQLNTSRRLAAARADAITELRARDEAAKAVVQWWAVASDPERSGEMRWDVPQEGREALDVLARAHETKDGGQDR